MAPNAGLWPRSLTFSLPPLPRKKSDDNHLPTTEKRRTRSSFTVHHSGIRHSSTTPTTSRVTISQTCFREEPTVAHTAPGLRGMLEGEGFNDRKITFIVVEGQQQWVGTEISRRIGGASLPARLFALEEWLGPIALPQIVDGGMYFEVDIPPIDNHSGTTRLRTYVHVRHRTPPNAAAERLQNTYTYYSRTDPTSSNNNATTTGPWITFIIVSPRSPPPAKQKAPQGQDSSVAALMKNYYRSNIHVLAERLCKNPSWFVMDLLNLTGIVNGDEWMAFLGNMPDWAYLFPPEQTSSSRMPLIPFTVGSDKRKVHHLYHPQSPAAKSAMLHKHIDHLLQLTTLISSQKHILERMLYMYSSLDLSFSPSPLGSNSGSHRRRNSYGSVSIDEELSGLHRAPSLSNPAPFPPPPRNNGVHLGAPPSPASTVFSTHSTITLPGQVNTTMQQLTYHLSQLDILIQQARNLAAMVTSSNEMQQRGSIATLAALGAVLGPLGIVGMIFLMVGFGGGGNGGGVAGEGGRGAEGWVYPLIGLLTMAIIGVLVGIVRRIGV